MIAGVGDWCKGGRAIYVFGGHVMLEEQLDGAFEMIYRSFNQFGKLIARDQERHPEHTAQLLATLGQPDQIAYNILVTGSKGKGSTAHFIAHLLQQSIQAVGLFTSPHLLDTLERIRINGCMITEGAFVETFETLRVPLEEMLDNLSSGEYVGPVGIFACMAAQYFHNQGVTYAVYETGRGALYDDVVRIHHECAAITGILLEHVRELGPSLSDIARHKAGVITSETELVVLGVHDTILEDAVRARVDLLGSTPRIIVAADYCHIITGEMNREGTRFAVEFADGRSYGDLYLPNVGAVIGNLALAITVAEHTRGRIDERDVRRAASHRGWPGRGEILSHTPFVLLDAGVRPESVASMLSQLTPFDRAVLSIPDGKDQWGMTQLVAQHAGSVVLTGCTNPRLAYRFDTGSLPHNVKVIENVSEALAWGMQGVESDSIFLCGTISFVADVYRWFGRVVP